MYAIDTSLIAQRQAAYLQALRDLNEQLPCLLDYLQVLRHLQSRLEVVMTKAQIELPAEMPQDLKGFLKYLPSHLAQLEMIEQAMFKALKDPDES